MKFFIHVKEHSMALCLEVNFFTIGTLAEVQMLTPILISFKHKSADTAAITGSIFVGRSTAQCAYP